MRRTIGIDVGTSGTKAVVLDPEGVVLQTAFRPQAMVDGLPDGWKEQPLGDFLETTRQCAEELGLPGMDPEETDIGLTGQMHGACSLDEDGMPVHDTGVLWCDARGERESADLSNALDFPCRARMTLVRLLMLLRNHRDYLPADLSRVRMTTPVGYVGLRATGVFELGKGEFSGKFPFDPVTQTVDLQRWEFYRGMLKGEGFDIPGNFFATPGPAETFMGRVTPAGAKLLGFPVGARVARPEGDQQTSASGTYACTDGDIPLSAGTSVVANPIGPEWIPSPLVDWFVMPNGKRFNMVWLKNGTTLWKALAEMIKPVIGEKDPYGMIVPLAEAAYAALCASGNPARIPACLPYLQTEIPAGYAEKPLAMLFGLNDSNVGLGEFALTSWLSVLCGIRRGLEQLRAKGAPLQRIFLSGGICKSEAFAAQTTADFLRLPVIIRRGAFVGSAYGAAVLAEYPRARETEPNLTYEAFMARKAAADPGRTYEPNESNAALLELVYQRFGGLNESARALCGM